MLPESASGSTDSRPPIMALTLNYSAYMSEVYRSGIQAIAKGQSEPPPPSA